MRKCAFPSEGAFSPDNWQCAAIGALITIALLEIGAPVYGVDETLVYVQARAPELGGWLVLTQYKRRGRCSSGIHIGDFFPPTTLTFELAHSTIEAARAKGAIR